MSYKSDVKPVVVASSSTNAVLFTGRTRLRGYMVNQLEVQDLVLLMD